MQTTYSYPDSALSGHATSVPAYILGNNLLCHCGASGHGAWAELELKAANRPQRGYRLQDIYMYILTIYKQV